MLEEPIEPTSRPRRRDACAVSQKKKAEMKSPLDGRVKVAGERVSHDLVVSGFPAPSHSLGLQSVAFVVKYISS